MDPLKSSIVYGEPASFMSFDLKIAKAEFFPDELQRIMTIRREANFYDISPEVTMEAWKIAMDKQYRPTHPLFPPSRSGYMRISPADDVPLVFKGVPRLNGFLWQGSTMYLVHDQGSPTLMAIAPLRFQTNISDSEAQVAMGNEALLDMVGDPLTVKPHLRLQATIISPQFNHDSTIMRTLQEPIEDMLLLATVLFDMMAETKATVVERSQVRNPFGSKQREYFETTRVVKISLSKCRAKYLRAAHEKTGRTNAWHEVRSHFRHRRVTKPDCQHRWVHRYAEDDGKHYKCEVCGEIKTRVEFPNGAGDKMKGIVKHVYEIVK